MTHPVDADIRRYIDDTVEEIVQQRLDDLEKQIQDLEIQGFQKQLNVLSDRLSALESVVLDHRREHYVRRTAQIESNARFVIHITDHAPSMPFPPNLPKQAGTCQAQMVSYIVQARERIMRHEDPKDLERLIDECANNVNETLKYFGFPTMKTV